MNIFTKRNRKTIYIHIGFMKTGTSAIQSFIKLNHSFFENNNFYFPPSNEEAMNYLAFSLLDEVPPYIHHTLPINANKLYKKLNNEIKKSKQDNIILTTEAFYLISTKYFLGEKAPKKLFDLLKNNNYNFKIIAFLRRQDEYLETQYNQHIKTHNFWNLYDKDIYTFYDEKKELFDFNLILNRWANVFGEENIKVKVYEKSKNSILDFLEVLGINEISKLLKNNDVNPKLSSKALEFMRLANKYDIEKRTAKQNYTLVQLIEDVLNCTDSKSSLLSQDDSKNIINDFYTGNIELSNKYLNGDTSWFDIKKIDKFNNLEENNNLTMEECVMVAAHIWNYYQKK